MCARFPSALVAVLLLANASAWAAPDITAKVEIKSASQFAVEFKISLCNNGDRTVTKFQLGLWYDEPNPLGCNPAKSPDIHWTQSNGILAGNCVTYNHTRTTLMNAGQTYTARVYADYTCAVDAESQNRFNNQDSVSYQRDPSTIVAPEIKDFTVSGDPDVSYSFNVCNNGGKDAPMTLFLYKDRSLEPSCSDPADEVKTLGTVSGGSCTTHQFTDTTLDNGQYTAWGLVCAAGATSAPVRVPYQVSQRGVTKPPPGGSADLVIKGFEATANAAAQRVDFSVTVCNESNALQGTVEVGLRFDAPSAPQCGESVDDVKLLNGLSGCQTVTFARDNVPAEQTFTAWAVIDPSCTINDPQRANNTGSRVYSLKSGGPAKNDPPIGGQGCAVLGQPRSAHLGWILLICAMLLRKKRFILKR
ncbi:MAG: hypothetical protein H6707_01710 [Deltaproteobacteria bacterium]|nr:hypothetical protein [Deltaproteobacteria bacterium]